MTIAIAGRHVSARLAVALLAVLVVLAGGLYLAWPRPPGPAPRGETPDRPSVPLMVSAGLPGHDPDSSVARGSELTVTGHALGAEAIVALELWDGPDRVVVAEATSAAPAFHTRWAWSADEPGAHVLLVRAVDELGRVAQSDPLRVTVTDAPVAMLPRGVLAASSAPPTYALALPLVQAAVDGCALALTIADGPGASGAGFALLALAPGASTFALVGTVSPSPGGTSFAAPLPAGPTLLAVTAFDASTEVYAAPIPVVAPDSCAADGWSGELRLEGGKLLPAPAADRAYLYLRQDGGAAKRVPAAGGTFVSRSGGAFDFSPVMPALDGSAFEFEAWGWANDHLENLGTGQWTPPAGAPGGSEGSASTWFSGALPGAFTTLNIVTSMDVAGGDCGTEFCTVEDLLVADTLARPPEGSDLPAKKHFRWSTLQPNVTHLMWQVLPYPPANSPDLNPPFLIDKGTLTVDPGQDTGDFTLDFAPYLEPGVPLLNVADQQPQNQQLIKLVFPTSPLPPASAATPTPAPAGGSNVAIGKGQLANPVGFGSRFYVRVIPIQAGVPSFPSGPVTLDVVDPAPGVKLAPSAKLAYQISFEVTPPRAANPAYARCAIVTAITAGYKAPSPLLNYPDYQALFASGQPICYHPPSDSGWSPFDAFDAFVEFVADVWDVVSSSMDWIRDKIVDAVLLAVPCKQIASDDVCEQIANTALDVALTSFGIPPSLPNFDAVVAAAKGDLAEFIVTAAAGLPGVGTACGLAEGASVVTEKLTTCQALAEGAIDEAVKQMVAARSDAASKAIGYPAWPHVVLAPDPRGQYQAPSVTFTATRTNSELVQIPGGCTVSASITSHLAGWTWDELTFDDELGSLVPTKASGKVSGSPFLPAYAPLPALKPGESFTRQVWLTEPQIAWTETNAAYLYWHGYKGLEVPNRAWVLLQKGAVLTYVVGGNCSSTVSQTHVLDASAYDG